MTTHQTRAPRRTPISGERGRLNVRGKDPNFVYRIVNDIHEGDRIRELTERGYEIVQAENIKVGDSRVATPTKEGTPVQISVGGGVKAYLMRIKKEWYEEDLKFKAGEIDKTEAQMKENAESSYKGKMEFERKHSG